MLTDSDLQALWLTARLAGVVTFILLLVGTPIAWWLARTKKWWKGPIGAVVALPLVLPPSVLGFYLLLAMGPHGPVGQLTQALGVGPLPFTFWGLVAAAEGSGRARLWNQMCAVYPPYAQYQAATSREIPVVVLERI